MKPIHGDMTVHQILTQYPHLIGAFKQHGLGKFETPETLDTLGRFLKLKTALSVVGVNPTLFVEHLRSLVDDGEDGNPSAAAFDVGKQRDLTVLALLPCGMKMPFNRAFDAFIAEYNADRSNKVRYLVEGNVNHEVSYYAYIDSISSLDELPDIIISSDINSFYHERFKGAFLQKSFFENYTASPMNRELTAAKLADPSGDFTMLSANLLVIVAIEGLMDGRAMPSSWGDLLDKSFANSVVMRGSESFFCNGVLLPFYKMFGMAGIETLARSVFTGVHPSQMVKMIDSRDPSVPPLYIMPYFFAKKIKRQDRIRIIVPTEGAIVSPVQMLVKKTASRDAQKVAEFLSGPKLGQICADAFFPSTHPSVRNVTSDIPLYWLGWPFLNCSDIGALKGNIAAVFRTSFAGSGGEL